MARAPHRPTHPRALEGSTCRPLSPGLGRCGLAAEARRVASAATRGGCHECTGSPDASPAVRPLQMHAAAFSDNPMLIAAAAAAAASSAIHALPEAYPRRCPRSSIS